MYPEINPIDWTLNLLQNFTRRKESFPTQYFHVALIKKFRFAKIRIIGILQEADAGMPVQKGAVI